MSRLANEKSVFDLFGVDLEHGSIAALPRTHKTEVRSRYKYASERMIRFVKWRQDHGTAITVASFVTAIVGTAVIVRIASAPPATTPLVNAGARLTVHTPRSEPGRLRAAPSLSAKVLALVPSGAEATVLGTAPSWYKLSTPKGEGWMHADIVRAAA